MNQPHHSNSNTKTKKTSSKKKDASETNANSWTEYVNSQAYQDFQNAMEQWEEDFAHERKQIWLNLDNSSRLVLLYLVVAKLNHAGQNHLSYRGTLYTEFEFDERSYASAQFSGLLNLHNQYDNKYDYLIQDYKKALELFNIQATEEDMIEKHQARFNKKPEDEVRFNGHSDYYPYRASESQEECWNDLNLDEKLLFFCHVVNMIDNAKQNKLDALACFEQNFALDIQDFESMPVFKEYYEMVDNAPSYQIQNMQQGLSLFGIEISQEDIALKLKL